MIVLHDTIKKEIASSILKLIYSSEINYFYSRINDNQKAVAY